LEVQDNNTELKFNIKANNTNNTKLKIQSGYNLSNSVTESYKL